MSSIHSGEGQNPLCDPDLGNLQKDSLHSKKLMPWIEQGKGALKRPPDSAKKDMMLMYVGMTRPTHMLCLAIRQSTLGRVLQEKAEDCTPGCRMGNFRTDN